MESEQAELELSLIKKIMEDSRNAVYDSGVQGIFWSILVAAALIINYIILVLKTGYEYIGLTWLVLMGLGTIISIIIGIKEKKRIKVKTFAGRILTSMWMSIGVSNCVIAFAAVVAHAYSPLYIIPIDSIVLGIGFFVTGTIQQLKFLKFLSWIWWAGGALFFVFPSLHSILYFSLMLIISLLIPAIQNRNNWKKVPNPAVTSESN